MARSAETGVSEGGTSVFKEVLKRDRLIGLAALVLFAALAWWYLLSGAAVDMPAMSDMNMDMPGMSGMAESMARPIPWTGQYAWIVFIMWWVMMIAMMLPSAAPMILLYGLINDRQAQRGGTFVPNGIFALGYITIWGVFSVIATLLQWQLDRVALMSPMMQTTSAILGGGILIAAGVYQLTPLKYACLKHCRGPIEFLTRHWRPGYSGAWRMGIDHGLYCLGCCWVLMALLFYGGVMNLYWIIGLTLFVLLEKIAPAGQLVSRLSGVVLIAWGGVVLAAATGLVS